MQKRLHAYPQTDHLGNHFDSEREMCRYHNIDVAVYRMNRKKGMSVKEALTSKNGKPKYTDHLGQEFKSQTDMCKHWGVSADSYSERIRKGWTVEKALTTPSHSHLCEDHLGNKFANQKEMCRYWNIRYDTYRKRRESGQTIEQILTEPVRALRFHGEVEDHLGNKFPHAKAMCKHWNVSYSAFNQRLRRGLSIEQALAQPYLRTSSMYNETTDHLGNKFPSITAMCEYWGVNIRTYLARRRRGSSLEEALSKMPLHAATDHNGTTYRSVKEMCEHWGIVLTTFYGRLNKGWSLEKALTTKANSTRLTEPAQDHLGNHFDTITAMCKHWGITTQIYYKRLNKGWELERILTTPPDRKPNKHKVIDADGREFKSIREFADFHNIPYSTALLRISKGMSVQELTEGSKRREVTAPDGTVFPNTSEMCRYYGVKRSTYQTRMEMGMTMSEALGLTNKDVKN